jgi:hypothetical protein
LPVPVFSAPEEPSFPSAASFPVEPSSLSEPSSLAETLPFRGRGGGASYGVLNLVKLVQGRQDAVLYAVLIVSERLDQDLQFVNALLAGIQFFF